MHLVTAILSVIK